MKTRYIKILRDLTSDYSKSVMSVIAIAIGIIGIGAVVGCYSVINREMTDNYMRTNPASATIETKEDITAEALQAVREMSTVKNAERQASIVARMRVGDKWYPLLLFIVDDFTKNSLNKFTWISGAHAPADGALLAERSALVVMQAKEGEEVLVKTRNGKPAKIKISGIVHDPSLAPAWQGETGYGYITLNTLHALGETQGFDQLRIRVKDNEYSEEVIEKHATAVADSLKRQGYTIREIQVPPPGQHPHQSQMNAVLSIFMLFSYLILVLGAILVATAMATIMVKQVRQIGVIKTIGATSRQVMLMYLLMIVILCVTALAIGIPMSRLAATAFYNQIAVLLNLEIHNSSMPFQVLLLQICSGVLIPLVVAAIPVIRGSRIPVREALANYGVSRKVQSGIPGKGRLQKLNLPHVYRLALLNVFRQQSRLITTVGLLAAGGAMFMTALNVSKAWDHNLGKLYQQRLYDQEIRLNTSVKYDHILERIRQMDGVKYVEGWNYCSTSFGQNSSYEITHTYPDKDHGSFAMMALPVPTQLLNLTLVEGRWLDSSAQSHVVLNQQARALLPYVKLGDLVNLLVDGKPTSWKIIGFTEDVGTPATAYVSLKEFQKQSHTSGYRMLRIAYQDRDHSNVVNKNKEVDKILETEQIPVSGSIPVWLVRNAVAAHMRVLVNSLIVLAILMALVGAVGLLSTMSMNVMERTREIGVMKAIGATPVKIQKMIISEGLLVGAFSVILAFITSLLLSYWMGRFIGNLSFRTPLSLNVSFAAVVMWVMIIVLGSLVATLFPARRANQISTREALGYE